MLSAEWRPLCIGLNMSYVKAIAAILHILNKVHHFYFIFFDYD